MQTLNLDYVFKTFSGKEIPYDNRVLTLKDSCLEALAMEKPGAEADKNDKIKRYKLGIKIADATNETEFEAEEIVLIKECICKAYGAIIYGKVEELLK